MTYFEKPNLIAEIGCNHMGNIDVAIELIDLAKQSNATYVKFQKRNNRELLSEAEYNAPHPVPQNSYGNTYGEHREYLEFNIGQHRILKEYCEKIGIGYSTSVWDVTSAIEIIELGCDFIKVPSACNTNFELLRILRDNYSGQVQLSVGMTTKEEIAKVVEFFEETNQAQSRLYLYSCTSGYPVPFKDICLLEILYLKDLYENRVNGIGFSGHHLGIAVDIAAYTLGATWIERHFTKDRTWKGTDHSASLEPSGLRKLARDLESTYLALTFKTIEILEIEEIQRKKLKR
jgi:N-acetylneuraminate synthase